MRFQTTSGWLIRLGLLVFLAATSAGCPTCAYLCYKISPDYPKNEDQTLSLPGLSAPVRVLFDQAGVPHVEASSEVDLVRTVGFLQARSRFFQMDMLRRFAQGRLSELLGEQPILDGSTVQTDLAMRWWGFQETGQQDADEMEGEIRLLMEAYTQGVNAALERHKPLEYRLLEVEPEPWRIPDSFAIGRLIAWTITHNMNQEISRLVLALHGGVERAETIYPSTPWPGASSLPPDGEQRTLPPSIVPEIREIFPARPYQPTTASNQVDPRHAATPSALQNGSSNAWVVGSSRSASGMPVLANDPHLTHFLPSLVYQQHLRCPGLDAIGVAVPGLPYVLAGHNERVAWGMTSAVADVVDLYIEQVDPSDPDLVLGVDGLFYRLEREEVVVRVRDGDNLVEQRATFRRSRNGRLLNDLYPGLLPEWAPLVSLRWETGGGGDSILGFALANRSSTVQELREALSLVAAPVNAWTAADVDGQVALFMAGRIPVRSAHLGTFAVPGWIAAYQWNGTRDPAGLPSAVGEGQTTFIHTNNLVVPPDRYPYPFHVDTGPSYRFDRIAELLDSADAHTTGSMAAIQLDIKLPQAQRLVPFLVADLQAASDLTALEFTALQLLEQWDYHARMESAAPSIFYETYREAFMEALRDEVDEAGLAFLLSERYATNAVDLWFDRPDHPVWDHRGTPQVESRSDVVREAFRHAVASLRERFGPDAASWRWGRLHDLRLDHPFGGRESLAGLVNLPAAELPGGPDSVWKSHFDLGVSEHPFRVIAGPVVRMVFDLADIHHGIWVLDTGSSGWPSDPHYGDQHERWLDGEYFPMVSDWAELQRTAVGVLTLE
ncbi:MAG: penicillin acylase family protein [Bradymonadales bacterium]|nr:penicillin acylase family protein [Bradymonadales bacterium]